MNRLEASSSLHTEKVLGKYWGHISLCVLFNNSLENSEEKREKGRGDRGDPPRSFCGERERERGSRSLSPCEIQRGPLLPERRKEGKPGVKIASFLNSSICVRTDHTEATRRYKEQGERRHVRRERGRTERTDE